MTNNSDFLGNIRKYYQNFEEKDRLKSNWGELEFYRSQEIIKRYLPEPPAVILDVGGGTGPYSLWLANEGYEVNLIDPVFQHIEFAKKVSEKLSKKLNINCSIGDARNLQKESSSVDVVLLMGPLYHLIEKQDRKQALLEAFRVLKEGGVLFGVGISRFASTIDGMVEGYYFDPVFRKIFLQDIENGQHRNPTNNPLYFTDTFFHHPKELVKEIKEAGFHYEVLIGIESIAYMLKDFDKVWENLDERKFLLDVLRRFDKDPTIIGASPHIMCVAFKR